MKPMLLLLIGGEFEHFSCFSTHRRRENRAVFAVVNLTKSLMCNTQTAEAEKWKIIKKIYNIQYKTSDGLNSTRNKNIPLFYFIISLFSTVYIHELSLFTAEAQRSALLCKDPKSSSNFEFVYTSTTIIDIDAVYDIKLKSPSLSSLPTSYAV